MTKKWTNEEIKFLRLNYITQGPRYCAIFLNRTPDAIQKKAQSMKIRFDIDYKNVDNLQDTYWNDIIWGAKRRNIQINISKEQAVDQFKKQNGICALSGLNLILARNYKDLKSGIQTASLDRIDSSRGYTVDNIQWLHKFVNTLKFNTKEDDFVKFCKLIANHKDKGRITV